MAPVKPITIIHAMFVNLFATNAVNTALIHSWEYDAIASIDSALRNSEPPHVYISVVTESPQELFSSLIWRIRVSQGLLALVVQWYTAARSKFTLFLDF
jgi:hypothetical protein